MKKFSNEVLEDLRGTGDYNQIWQKIRHLIDVASGIHPTEAATRVASWFYVEVMPTFDPCTGGVGKIQTGWELIFVKADKHGTFKFHTPKNSICGSYVRKKDGKAKATTKFTDAVFLYLFENGSVCL